ncbi:hypothetical protein PSEUBRA_005776 [Kalmanozyma brasiliensis GHG001]|uniref:Uncharacterized protein n=1 Tax=Kalmanozyma brasiliensis (strain GHG001) TaxID=1365824 RepID=V5EJM7_KALBG|nr:uncharacterized protein PSEUBRA_005776 [Kalmanozyma brasiliensis GHG001]EST04975.1 hypothetical protein PSEUBRA_005776 [Kalmanozyma brasiliensis GHG001]
MAHPQTAFAPQGATVSAFSALNIIWLLHAALEGPVAFIGLFLTRGLAFKDEINNTTAVIIKLYATLSLALSIVCILLYGLPDYLPGKRAAAILLLLYHGVASSVLLNAEPFIDFAFPALLAKHGVRVESVAGVAHGFLSLLTVSWWQASLSAVRAQNGTMAAGPAASAKGGKGKRK